MGQEHPAERFQVATAPQREAAKFFRVRGLDQYQHYKDRNPPWVKLYASLLFDDYEFTQLPDATKFQAVALISLASKLENKIPNDPAWVAGRIGAQSPVDFDALLSIRFLEPWRPRAQSAPRKAQQLELPEDGEEGENPAAPAASETDASKMLASCYQSASTETETAAETEAEPETHTETAAPAGAGRRCECCGSCVFSAFSFKDALALTEKWKSEGRKVGGQPIENAGGLARTLHREGTADAEIALMLNPPVRREFTDEPCTTCLGVRQQVVPGKGARKCPDCVNEEGRPTGKRPRDRDGPRGQSP